MQDQSIWNYSSIYESLNLKKSKISLKTATILGINAVIVLAIPFYYVLKPLYIEFDSAIFFSFLIIIIVISVAFLKIRNDFKLKEMVNVFDENSFVFDLTPHEIIYVKNTNLKDVLISSINKMLDDGSLSIRDKKIKVTRGIDPKNSVEK